MAMVTIEISDVDSRMALQAVNAQRAIVARIRSHSDSPSLSRSAAGIEVAKKILELIDQQLPDGLHARVQQLRELEGKKSEGCLF